jgi:hypothetical protein
MKKILLLGLMFSLFTIVKAQKGTDIFHYGTKGEVVASTAFIAQNMMPWRNDIVAVPYKTCNINSENGDNSYKINLQTFNYPDIENSFGCIQISNARNDSILLTLKNLEVWVNTKFWSNNKTDNDFIPIHLSEETLALVFTGWSYNSTPPLTTIVILKDGKATLVFNKYCNILDFQQDASHFSFTYANEFQEYSGKDNKFQPSDKDLKKFKVWKEGNMLKYAPLN